MTRLDSSWRRAYWYAAKAWTCERPVNGWWFACLYFWAHRDWWKPRCLGGRWAP